MENEKISIGYFLKYHTGRKDKHLTSVKVGLF